jgi:hypothetical protein
MLPLQSSVLCSSKAARFGTTGGGPDTTRCFCAPPFFFFFGAGSGATELGGGDTTRRCCCLCFLFDPPFTPLPPPPFLFLRSPFYTSFRVGCPSRGAETVLTAEVMVLPTTTAGVEVGAGRAKTEGGEEAGMSSCCLCHSRGAETEVVVRSTSTVGMEGDGAFCRSL